MPALLKARPTLDIGTFATGLNVWDRIDEWEETAAARQAGTKPSRRKRPRVLR